MKKNKGFTLVELLIVVAIIGIIAAIAIPNLLDAMNRSRHKASGGDMKTLGVGVESYKVDHYGQPIANGSGQTSARVASAALDLLGYLKSAPVLDSWGNDLQYWTNGVVPSSYRLGSAAYGNGPGKLMDGTGIQLDPLAPANVQEREMRTWTCDIVFEDGQFVFPDKGAGCS